MEALCSGAVPDSGCEVSALTAALHALHLYCTIVTAVVLLCCCSGADNTRQGRPVQWRGQNIRGNVSLLLSVVWCCGAAVGALRTAARVQFVASLLAPPAWLSATWLHGLLTHRRTASPLIYLFLYWLLCATSSAAILYHHIRFGFSVYHINIYIHSSTVVFSVCLAVIDWLSFYDEVAKRISMNPRGPIKFDANVAYKHKLSYYYSKLTFFWLTPLLIRGYKRPLEQDDLGDLPEDEYSKKHHNKLKKIYENDLVKGSKASKMPNLWTCFMRMIYPNFYIGGILKLLGDIMGLVPPIGLGVVVHYIDNNVTSYDYDSHVTLHEFFNNGYVMIFIITIASIGQALLSQNSTQLISVEGIRLKTALQGMLFDKSMRLAPSYVGSSMDEENKPLLKTFSDDNTEQVYCGLLTNLVSQDTYNIMSCVWICHYIWAIPLKVSLILYLLYTKLGVSAIIGCMISVTLITPLQFYVGKKISDNSKEIAKTSDHRVSKMTEILHGITVIKLYVWEDLFKEKIMNVREVELKLLNRDSVYWSILTFSTQISTILVTVITFCVYYFMENNTNLTAINIFAGLALFNQLSVPLLILPVTVLMVVQAMVSKNRIADFLELPDSHNYLEDDLDEAPKEHKEKLNNAFVDYIPTDEKVLKDKKKTHFAHGDHFSDEDKDATIDSKNRVLLRINNAAFTWALKRESSPNLEIDDLEIMSGKIIMIVGSTGAGKSSLLSAVLGEMYLEKGDIIWNWPCSTWYAGQPPWLQEGTIRDNILMGGSLCQQRYARVLRATGLRPDLQLLPEGDATRLGARGAPLSGGQRVRLCIARALYSRAKLLALDEPLGALDATLARHVVARGLLPAAKAGRTVLIATNRLELLHYADMVIVMEMGRVAGWGPPTNGGVLGHWLQMAAEARALAARGAVGPAGGTARERSRLVRELSRAKLQSGLLDETITGVNQATGSHFLTEVPACAGGSWRRRAPVARPSLSRQLSSPPPLLHHPRWHRRPRTAVRRVVSADSSSELRREASVLRSLLGPRSQRTLTRWTPRPFRKLLLPMTMNSNEHQHPNESSDDCVYENDAAEEETCMTNSSEMEVDHKESTNNNDWHVWYEYARACGWWSAVYWVSAATAQGFSVAADWWLANTVPKANETPDLDEMWQVVSTYAFLCCGGATFWGVATVAGATAGAKARRTLHERLLHSSLHATLQHHHSNPLGAHLHRFSSDILLVDKKVAIGVTRWAQLSLVCISGVLVAAVGAPLSLIATVPALACYFTLQDVYRRNARELQRLEAETAAPLVNMAAEVRAGAVEVRAGRLQTSLRAAYLRSLNDNHNALLLLHATNRWLGLAMDVVGSIGVCAALIAASVGSRNPGGAGLAGTYSLLLPAYLAHLAKCRADLDLQLAAVQRICADSNLGHEDYREECTLPAGWPADQSLEFDNISVKHENRSPPVLADISLKVAFGERVAVCGRSGSGKSSLLMSCAGGADITEGRLLVGGIDARRIPLRALRHRLVVLPQENVLFTGTLRENLDPLAVHDDHEIWHSLRIVGLQEFVSAQPAGLECWVSGHDACVRGWSAGRRARAGAARAVLRAPLAVALLLDEPAAALDAASERALLNDIAAAAPQTIIITVAHRLSSVRSYDRVVVLERGRVVEQGSPPFLLAEPRSRFARMLAASAARHSVRV